jgi:ferritin
LFSESLQDALNNQIKHEMESAYVYLSMSAYFESLNLTGFARWMQMQSREEMSHAMKFYNFINDRGGRVLLQSIPQPPHEFQSPLEAFEKAYEHERKISALIHQIYDLAVKENDYPTQVMLNWFVEEQVEEEKSTSEVVELLRLSGGQGAALIMLDRQLGQRSEEDDD